VFSILNCIRRQLSYSSVPVEVVTIAIIKYLYASFHNYWCCLMNRKVKSVFL